MLWYGSNSLSIALQVAHVSADLVGVPTNLTIVYRSPSRANLHRIYSIGRSIVSYHMRMAITIKRHGSGSGVASATILLALMLSKSSALTQQYCSSQNTGADSSPGMILRSLGANVANMLSIVQDNFQSNGACQTTCEGYAFAVVQYQSCWCSDYVPADTTSTSSCSVACPGYPYEDCGDEAAGLFGYVALGPAPSGTQGSASSEQDPSPTQATLFTVQSVSAQSLPVAFSGAHSPSVPSFSFTSRPPSTSLNGPLTVIRSTPVSFETHVLTFSVQYSSPDPSSVTVLATVTDKPSVKVSYVSLVCLFLPYPTCSRACMCITSTCSPSMAATDIRSDAYYDVYEHHAHNKTCFNYPRYNDYRTNYHTNYHTNYQTNYSTNYVLE